MPMPRITAQTVAENRDFRQAALLDAASQIAHTDGVDAVTVAAVAKRAGLARSSFYSYFDSAADVIADVLADELDEMRELLADRVRDLHDARSIVDTWIDVSLSYVLDGRHALVREAAKVDIPATRRAQLAAMHKEMMLPLIEALTRARVVHPVRSAQYIAAAVDVCVRRIEAGAPIHEEVAETLRFVTQGLGLHDN